jgi:hypothetical protein
LPGVLASVVRAGLAPRRRGGRHGGDIECAGTEPAGAGQEARQPGGRTDQRADINATFVQPFVSYTTPDAVTYTLNTESTYDWEARQWSVPVNAVVSKVTKLGDQLVSFGGGVRYWADSPDAGAKGFGLRVAVTLLFPR